MTNPPEPGQFDPWNRQTQSGFPQAGGAPRDPRAEETTRQLPAIGSEPPHENSASPRKRTGLVVGITLGALAVAGGGLALALTGGDDEPPPASALSAPPTTSSSVSAPSSSSAPPSSSASSEAPPSSTSPPVSSQAEPGGVGTSGDTGGEESADSGLADLQDVADELIDGLNAQDADALRALMCSPNSEPFPELPDELVWSLAGEVTVNGEQGTVPVQASYQGTTESLTFDASNTGDGWCLSA
ncbi:hypothetical protein [Saccharomonospora xinjiangensis]|uniref:Uncharacterized protein n=1 Tax=Saccharomonospora xinjiangensis XJ-54 TaxID=882086 RepID=I0V7V3_9PSEU|nr:hypothetical protein [Saccharomonospora xinjiangensis]EID56206.1 hypothetical protein SacxiDRAFT_4016 [Saccharomonospora xinjiangensis XJ-54]